MANIEQKERRNFSQPKVRIFITPFCPYCVTLKEFFKKNKVAFEEIDVLKNEKDKEEMVRKSGALTVPVVEIDNEIVIGFDKEKISKLLNIKE